MSNIVDQSLRGAGSLQTIGEVLGMPGSLQTETPDAIKFPKTKPTFMDALGEAIRVDNPLVSPYYDEPGLPSTEQRSDQSKLYMQRAIDDGYGSNKGDLDNFAYVSNEEQYNALKRQYDNINTSKQIIADAGWKGVAASLASNLTNPLFLIPVGGQGVAAAKIGGKFLDAFKSADAALSSVGAVLPSMTASELLLQEEQRVRSNDEVWQNIATATMAGAVLGTVGKGFHNVYEAHYKQAEIAMDNFLKNPTNPGIIDDVNYITNPGRNDTGVGAGLEKVPTTAAQETVMQPDNVVVRGAFKAALNTTGRLAPQNRILMGDNLAAKDVVQSLTDISLALEKNKEGIATPDSVVSNVRAREGLLITAVSNHKDIFQQYRKEGGADYRSFNEAIGVAMRNGDIALDGNKHVTEAAQSWRKNFYDPIKEEAIKVGILPEDIKIDTAISYLNRVYNTKKIQGNLSGWYADITPHFTEMLDQELSHSQKIVDNFKRGTTEIDGKKYSQKDFEEAQNNLSYYAPENIAERQDYVRNAVQDTTNKILGFDQIVNIVKVQMAERGPLKDRTFGIQDNRITNWLMNDIEDLAHRFHSVINPEIELQRKFGTVKFSATDSENPLVKKITDEMNQKLLDPKLTDKQREKIAKDTRHTLEDLGAIWDLTRGTYKARKANADDWVRKGLAATRTFIGLRSLGQIVVSSGQDPLILARANGYSRFFKASLGIALNSALRGMNKRQTQYLGKSGNITLNSIIKNLYGIGDPYGRGSAFERGLNELSRFQGIASGMSHWNDWHEGVASLTTQMRLMDNIKDFMNKGSLTQKEEIWMNHNGMAPELRSRIAEQFQKFGDEQEGFPILNTMNWTDKEAARIINAEINKNISSQIVIKSPGEAPILAEGSFGKNFLQFMSFAFAANNKVFLSGLQQADARWLATEVNFALMAVAIYAAKEKLAGREVSHDNGELFLQALQNSPELMIPLYANNYADALGLGLNQALSDHPRRADKSRLFSAALGPSAGLISDGFGTIQLIHKLFKDKNPSASEINSVRRLIPLNNLIVGRQIFDYVQDQVDQHYNIQPKVNQQ